MQRAKARCIFRSSPVTDTLIVNLVKLRATGNVAATITRIEIYQSDVAGDYIIPGHSGPIEDAYDGSGTLVGTAAWSPGQRNDTLLNADYLGVRITYLYTYLTAFISGASTLQLTASSVERIEPQDTA